MKYQLNIDEAKVILANAEATPLEKVRASFVYATFGKDSEAVKDYAEKHNAEALAKAISTMWNADKFSHATMLEKVFYPFINAEAVNDSEAVKMKQVNAWDIFCVKSTKNSKKTPFDMLLLGMLNQFGHNMGVEFVKDKKVAVSYRDKCLAELKLFTKFSETPKVFLENATSNKGHERQLQAFADTFLGEGVVTITKEYVDHLKEKFITATDKGYADKSEAVLLQLIYNEVYNCKHDIHYKFKSKLTCHNMPKEKNSK